MAYDFDKEAQEVSPLTSAGPRCLDVLNIRLGCLLLSYVTRVESQDLPQC